MAGFFYAFSLLIFIYGMMGRMSLIRQPYRHPPATWQLAVSVLQGTLRPSDNTFLLESFGPAVS